jgi:hypothetical protein
MRAALFIMRATNSSLVFTFSLYTSLFIHSHRLNLICKRQLQTVVSPRPLKIGQMFIWTDLIGIFHTTTSSNIYYSSRNNLYITSTEAWNRPDQEAHYIFGDGLRLSLRLSIWLWVNCFEFKAFINYIAWSVLKRFSTLLSSWQHCYML